MGEWRTNVQISDCLSIQYGKDQKLIEDSNGIYPILGTGGVMGYTNHFLHDRPSVLIGRKGTIDVPQYMETPFWTIDTLYYTNVFPENCAKYLFYVFQTIPWKKYNEASGVPSLAGSTIGKIKISLPNEKAEQSKIAEVLATVDEAINKTSALIEKYELVKQGLMRDLIDVESVAKCPLSDIGRWYGGITPSMSNHLYWGEGVYWLSSGEVKAPLLYHSSKQVTNLAISNTALRRLPEKTIVIIVRSGILKKYLPVAELQTTMAINQDIKGIILHEGVDSKYVLHALTYYGDKILRTCMKIGTTVQSVDLKWLKSFRIPLPPFPEQKRIAGIINTADEKIQTEQAYLAKLQNIKRGLMQDLLNNAVSVDALL